MNNGRMWCVVNPTVGLPIFLGAVALTSMTVHHALLNHTTWVGDFLNGKARKVAMESTVSPVAVTSTDPGYVINVAPVANGAPNGGTSFVVTVSPKATTASNTVTSSAPGDLAMVAAPAK